MHSTCRQLRTSACVCFLVVVSTAAGQITITPLPTTVNPPILGPSATVVLPTAAYAISRSVNGLFQRVGIPPDQVAQVTVQYPSSQSGEFVKVEAVDGGLVAVNTQTPPTLPPVSLPIPIDIAYTPFGRGVISANGTFTFVFKAGHTPGLYQLRLKPNGLQYTQTDQVLAFRFWVLDPAHPENNPPVITPTMTGGVQ